MSGKKRIIVIVVASVAALLLILYLGGMLGQVLQNYAEWRENDGMAGKVQIKAVNPNPINCFQQAFSAEGLKSILGLLFISGAIFVIYKLHDKFDGKERDPRGFVKSRSGAYGTASWMTDKEMREVLEISEPGKAEGVILGEYKGKTVGLPKNTRLNRHIAVFGASGTGKSRAVIRNSLFQALKNNESVVITDPKGELYADTAEMYRRCGYEVKVYNLVNPGHSDSWNCMSDLCGDTLMAQVLTNVIIGNTSSGKGDHFWDNGEGNLLKALVLYIDQDPKRAPEDKHLPAVYQMLTQNNERQLTAMFERLPLNHPARAPYNLFAQSSDTVRSGIVLGLGTRLQVLQDRAVQAIAGRSDIDLTAPGKRKCAYYIILSDQDTTMAFLSSLFFSFLFIKLTRFADSCEGRRCPVPVMGYTSDRKYRSHCLTYDEFLSSIMVDFDRETEMYVKGGIERIEFDAFKLNPGYDFTFDLCRFYTSLLDYINCEDSGYRHQRGLKYGFDCEKEFVNYIKTQKGKYLDERYSRFFMELKELMVRRLEYLTGEQVVSQGILSEYQKICEQQRTVHLLFIKYNLTMDERIIDRLADKMNGIIESEKIILPRITDEIYACLVKKHNEEYL